MLVDYHIHSNFSEDSTTSMREHIDRAMRFGMQEICFTEHLEYGFNLGDWKIDIPEYFRAIDGFASLPIRIRKGCEAGIACDSDNFVRLKEDVGDQFDFVLISLHELYGSDPLREDIFISRTPSMVCRDYVQLLYDRARYFYENSFRFNSIAHIDYLSKSYGSRHLPDGQFKYALAADEMDELFRFVIERGKCIELNTSPWRSNGQNPPFDMDWLMRYSELGGEYISIGSDAHSPEYIGHGIKDAMELAKACNIKYFATFVNGEPTMHRLV